MQFGVVGLGRMGGNLAVQAHAKGHTVMGWDAVAAAGAHLGTTAVGIAPSLAALVAALPVPRVVLVYVPHGPATDAVIERLRVALEPGDIVVDGGNSHWQDGIRRHASLAERGIRFLDVGTSGGVRGAREGACFMVGGDADAYAVVAPLLRDLAVDEQAVLHTGGPGTGHFTKLVHNAIEFGMVQAIGEGVELLERADFSLDLPALFRVWGHGSVIRGWLVDLMAEALAATPDRAPLSTYVEDTGEVKWVVAWALDKDIPLPVTSLSQTMLTQYRDTDCPAAKAVALLRHGYGGHPVHRKKDPG